MKGARHRISGPEHLGPFLVPVIGEDGAGVSMLEPSVMSIASADTGEDGEQEQQVLMRRLWKSDELIKQLKHIIKAQHSKIEELRLKLENDTSGGFFNFGMHSLMNAEDVKERGKVQDANQELARTVNKLQAEAIRMKMENETLKKVNRRLKGMVQQTNTPRDGMPLPAAEIDCPPKTPGEISSGARSARGRFSGSAPPPRDAARSPAPASRAGPRATVCAGPLSGGNYGTAGAPAPVGTKLSRMVAAVSNFWKDQETPRAVLNALLDVATKMLSDVPSTTFTLYIVDPWLRSAATEANEQPTLFYLQGRLTVQVLQRDGARAEQPRFADLSALPVRTKTTIAVAVLTPSTVHRRLAVLQVVSVPDPRGDREPGSNAPTSGRLPLAGAATSQESVIEAPTEPQGFADSQLLCLQLLCHIAGGVLEQQERLGKTQLALERLRACIDVTVDVNKARNLADFEQRVKHSLGTFFGVSAVRILFFNPETEELLLSQAQSQSRNTVVAPSVTSVQQAAQQAVRRKGCLPISIDKGVVGLCAKRRAVVHVANISQHPYVDSMADGLQRTGRPIAPDAAMLCGPLVVDYDEGSRLVGVVQLIERSYKGKSDDGEESSSEFSKEEQGLFSHLMQICAHAAWRTYKVQELSAKLSGSPATMAQMLAG